MVKRILSIAAALVISASFAADSNTDKSALAKARAQISQVIGDTTKMTAVMKSLPKAEQVAFLAEVNAAIAAMPGDSAERTATFVAVNNAALLGAQKGNALALVAEVYATVPPYALIAVGESLSSGLMNRAADKSVTYTDEQYARIAQMVVTKVNERAATESDAGIRSALAGLMLINASNNASPAIVDAVVAALPESVRNNAKNEWYPAAMANGNAKSYDPILAAAEGSDYEIVKQSESREGENGPQVSLRADASVYHTALLADIVASSTDPLITPAGMNPIVDAIEVTGDDNFSDTAPIINQVQRAIEGNLYPQRAPEGDLYQHQRP